MEDMLRYDQDLIYMENGFFGLTNGGEAEEGMSIALIGDSDVFYLLKSREGCEGCYRFVDMVFLNFLGGD